MLKKILIFGGGTLFGVYTTLCTVVAITSLRAFCGTKNELEELKKK